MGCSNSMCVGRSLSHGMMCLLVVQATEALHVKCKISAADLNNIPAEADQAAVQAGIHRPWRRQALRQRADCWRLLL